MSRHLSHEFLEELILAHLVRRFLPHLLLPLVKLSKTGHKIRYDVL